MQELNLYPFPAWLTPQIPATVFNAVSYEEMIRQFIYKLNEVVKRCNDVQQFSEEVKKILDDMNAHIQKITTDILTEWYENGTLEEILENVSREYFDNLSQSVYQLLARAQLMYAEESRSLYLDLLEYRNESEVTQNG